MNASENRGVFLYDEPTVAKLKSCSFFWKNIMVFESYLNEIEWSEKENLAEPTLALLKEGILKIFMLPNRNLKTAIEDKVYYGLDEAVWEYIHENAEKVAISPNLPQNIDEIIGVSTKMDSQDSNLKDLMDAVIYNTIREKWMDGLRENERIPLSEMPPEMKTEMTTEVDKLTNFEFSHYLQRGAEERFDFERRNEYLLYQMSVSSALFTPLEMLPYYSYKLGDYSIKDARKYLAGLNAVMPFVSRQSFDEFTLEEIIEIRRRRKWNEAMVRLSELCNEVKSGLDIEQFSREIYAKVISEYQDALDQESVTWKDLGSGVAKGSAFTGISLIPIVGPIISTVGGLADPIVSYFRKEKQQKSLPVFLNDLRKLG